MIHEYRTYTIHPGQLERYLALADTRAIPIRGDDYGRLVAFWWSEAGALNQVHHIWEYPGLDDRQAQRARMFDNPRWREEFLAGAWPTMQVQDVRFMVPRSAFVVPQVSPVRGNVYETRIYRTVVGRFLDMARAVEARPRGEHSQLVCVYTCETPQPNEVCEIVAYRDANARLDAHSQAREQSAWLNEHGAGLLSITSSFLLPTSFSPLQ